MQKTFRVVAVALAVALMLVSVAAAGEVLDRILKKGELRVGVAGDMPPKNATTKGGDIIGFDADLARSIAEKMGVKVSFVSLPFADLLPALQKGKVDMVISAMTMLPERNLKVAFVGPYFVSGKGVLTKTRNVETFRDTEGLNRAEFKVAVLKDSTSENFVGKYAPKAQAVAAASYDAAIAMLLADKVDALVADFPFCAYAAFRYADRDLTAGRSRLSFEPLGIAVPEDALLINWTQNYLMTMEGSGRLGRIGEFWFKNADWIKQIKE